MRAPPESFRPITGAPTFIAWSITLQIFSACASRQRAAEDGEVLAEDEHQAAVDHAVAGDDAVARDLVVRPCRSRRSGARRTCPIPRSVPSSSSSSSRSRAVSLPLACCASMRFCAAAQARRGALVFELFDDVVHGGLSPRCSVNSIRSSSRRAATEARERGRRRTSARHARQRRAHRRVVPEALRAGRRRCAPTSRPAPARGGARRAGRWPSAAARNSRHGLPERRRGPSPFSALSCSTCGCQPRRRACACRVAVQAEAGAARS